MIQIEKQEGYHLVILLQRAAYTAKGAGNAELAYKLQLTADSILDKLENGSN